MNSNQSKQTSKRTLLKQSKQANKCLLLILDGFGEPSLKDLQDPKVNRYNAIFKARTPFFDQMNQSAIKTQINASSNDVGLPESQMGNSEVGHLNLGAGRIVYQDIVRINQSIQSGEFNQNQVLVDSFSQLSKNKKNLHILGLLSEGGVHSHQNHLLALYQLALKYSVNQIYFHAILDGRDVPPRSAQKSIEWLESTIDSNRAKIATIVGRFYAMDRDKHWDRIKEAYDLYTKGQTDNNLYFDSARSALLAAYGRDENDEFVQASNIAGFKGIQDDDLVIFMNFRADRARQMTQAFVDVNFSQFERETLKIQDFITLTQYQENLNTKVVFNPVLLTNTLGEVLAKNGKKQLRIAETEKYAHVTYFFSGGKEDLFEGEDRKLIQSPNVKTYDLKPEMSAIELTQSLIHAIQSHHYDFIVCNFANPDMVGHTGNLSAAIEAIEVIDSCLSKISKVCETDNYQLLITADHGNVEKMFDDTTKQAHTAHTTNPVPLYYLGNQSIELIEGGKLSNIAPTVLDLMAIIQPIEMSEKSLVEGQKEVIN